MHDRLTSRREFLGCAATLGGIAFVGCDMLAGRHVHAQPRRRETIVSGKRARVIDVHAHCAVPEAMGLMGNGYLSNVVAFPLETSIALSHLVFEGTLDRFPGLKICAAHGGGYLPSYAGRSDHGGLVRPDLCPGGTHGPIRKKPTEYLRQMYYDTMVFSPEGVRHLAAEVGASQLMVGTDYPFPWTKTAVEEVMATPGLSDADKVAILGGTAARLLGING